VHLRLPIDWPVDLLGKIRIILVTTFEHLVPLGYMQGGASEFRCWGGLGTVQVLQDYCNFSCQPIANANCPDWLLSQ